MPSFRLPEFRETSTALLSVVRRACAKGLFKDLTALLDDYEMGGVWLHSVRWRVPLYKIAFCFELCIGHSLMAQYGVTHELLLRVVFDLLQDLVCSQAQQLFCQGMS